MGNEIGIAALAYQLSQAVIISLLVSFFFCRISCDDYSPSRNP